VGMNRGMDTFNKVTSVPKLEGETDLIYAQVPFIEPDLIMDVVNQVT